MKREQAESLVINELASKYGIGIIGKEVTFAGGIEEEIFQYAVDEKMKSHLWTREKPTQPGWYWVCHVKSDTPMITYMTTEGKPMYEIHGLEDCKWAGPLTPPEEG